MGRASPPRIATRLLGSDSGSVRAARDFTAATLHRWGVAERGPDITLVVSELLTNALRHALPGSGDTGPRRPVWLGLLQPGPCVLCAVADPSKSAPMPQTPGSLAETGRGLHIICTLSDQWGYTTPSETGKVVWALFHSGCHRRPRPGTRAGEAATGCGTWPLGKINQRDLPMIGRGGTTAIVAGSSPRCHCAELNRHAGEAQCGSSAGLGP